MKKPQVIALNKMDVSGAGENLKKFKKRLKGTKVYPVSAVTKQGVRELLEAVFKKVKTAKKNEKK
jgi:GTP-binding protein